MTDEMIGKGLPVWLPNGETLKGEIEKFAVETEEARILTCNNSSTRKEGAFRD